MLLPSGFLVLGAGESMMGLSTEYAQVQSEGGVIYRKKNIDKVAA
jgi:chemotaxis methyl-accepting protein methylase